MENPVAAFFPAPALSATAISRGQGQGQGQALHASRVSAASASGAPVSVVPAAAIRSRGGAGGVGHVTSGGAGRQLIVVSCYTRFDNLAHGPRGTEANRSLYTFAMDPSDGQMVLLSVTKDEVMNPAFSRFHPRKNLLYTCTESVAENGQIVTWKVCPETGRLSKVRSSDAGGTSTCYLTLDKECKNMLVVNYWDATIGVFGVDPKRGHVDAVRSTFDPNGGRKMKARHDKHVNHSQNDHSAQAERQADPHSHAVVLDSYFGRVAFVPDLGMDVIRQFRYDPESGALTAAGSIRSGPEDEKALGPRYIEFHPTLPMCYVVNELASEVSVFEFDLQEAQNLLGCSAADVEHAAPVLRLVQTIRTVPDAFPGDLNTCGRIAVHAAGNFVLVSNRGHDSIAVFRVHRALPRAGMLSMVGNFHTRGATPRHFQFDASGQWLITANQDSDRICVFRFNLATGRLDWTGHEYHVPSPNFVCNVQPHLEEAVELGDERPSDAVEVALSLGQQQGSSSNGKVLVPASRL